MRIADLSRRDCGPVPPGSRIVLLLCVLCVLCAATGCGLITPAMREQVADALDNSQVAADRIVAAPDAPDDAVPAWVKAWVVADLERWRAVAEFCGLEPLEPLPTQSIGTQPVAGGAP